MKGNNLPHAVQKYIEKYSLKTWKLQNSIKEKYELAVVIPVISEFENVKILLDSLGKNDDKEKVTLIFVVNNLKSSSQAVKTDNANLLAYLKSLGKNNKYGLNINFIDAASSGNELPGKDGGVGLARKIGMDAALEVLDHSSPNKKIIVALDADCRVQKNYFFEILNKFNTKKFSAAYISFSHTLPENIENKLAIINYEIFLRYYVLGLMFARSPYAIHTIGSTIVVDFKSYIKIGGMNKRKAGEDFYFMEKLAKVVEINTIDSTTVYPSARSSWRVPFGTGQRVGRFLLHKQNEYLLYSPKSFKILKRWLNIFNSARVLTSQEYLDEAERINHSLFNFLQLNKFSENWNKILTNSKSNEQIQFQKKLWFDGFKTLKLIHYLRDNAYPDESMFDAIDKLLDMLNIKVNTKRKDIIPHISEQIRYLELLVSGKKIRHGKNHKE